LSKTISLNNARERCKSHALDMASATLPRLAAGLHRRRQIPANAATDRVYQEDPVDKCG